MQRLLEQLRKDIRKATMARAKEGRMSLVKGDIAAILADYRKRYPSLCVRLEKAELVRQAAEQELQKEWVSERITEKTQAISKMLGSDYAAIQGNVNQSLVKAVRRGVSEDLELKDLTRLIDRAFDRGIKAARTVARTARLAQNRADYLREAIGSGATRFKYSGPSAERNFCSHHLGEVYTIKEILELNNGQGLPVLAYMGGYNCRHRWLAVYD